ncbi:hypothetical protein F5Y16DRAFT_399755 [Xylariaceae sp. FL0255]|nr:hypothetical protein F5Y16DRAFT_399755 [Xylariaceae sp. FL0255]
MASVFGMAISYVLSAVLHFIIFILSLVVIGLYGQYVDEARKAHVYADPKWVYAVVVGALSAVSTFLFLIPKILRYAVTTIWSFIMFILWIALFGVFGSLYIHARPEGDHGIQEMKNAVWVDLVVALLWLIGTVGSAAYWWTHREYHTRFTGRATI